MAAAAKGVGQARGPKLAELFLKTHERQPQPLRGSQAQFVETHFEVEDASACKVLTRPDTLRTRGLTTRIPAYRRGRPARV